MLFEPEFTISILTSALTVIERTRGFFGRGYPFKRLDVQRIAKLRKGI